MNRAGHLIGALAAVAGPLLAGAARGAGEAPDAGPEPPPFARLGKPGDVIDQVAVRLESPKKSADRIDGGLHHVVFSLWLPDRGKPARGLLLMPFNVNGVEQEHSRAMCRHWGFGLVGSNFMRVDREEFGPRLLDGLRALALKSGHPEVAHAPLIATSMSAGVGMCVGLAEQLPDRFLCCGLACLEVGPETPRTREVPMLSVFGERDGRQMAQHEELLPRRRAAFDAEWAIAPQWGRKHEWGQANNLLWPFFDEVIARRLPPEASAVEGPVKLRPSDPALAWYGDPATWRSRGAAIAPAGAYRGDRAAACWFPGPRTARAWRAFVVPRPTVRIASPTPQGDGKPLRVYGTRDEVEVAVEADDADAGAMLSLHDGADRLAEGRLDGPTGRLKVGPLAPGVHTLIARATRRDGSVELSRPVVVLVASEPR